MDYYCSMTKQVRNLLLLVFLLWVICLGATHSGAAGLPVVLSGEDSAILRSALDRAPTSLSPSERIARISGSFLNTPYKANALIGSPSSPEVLVAELSGFDCFTFLDVVEALRRSDTEDDFIQQLINVRYENANISYLNRRHFFSDWVNDETDFIVDVTAQIGEEIVLSKLKRLNSRSAVSLWLNGIPVKERIIDYLPADKISKEIVTHLKTGDYVGIYADKPGLDVQHTGIIIKHENRVYLRHASSAKSNNAVVDDDLLNYLHDKKGLVVYRVNTGEQ